MWKKPGLITEDIIKDTHDANYIDLVKKSWQEVNQNLGKFQSLFGASNILVVDNSEYKEFPKTFLGLKIIKTNILKDETILLGTEEQFIKYNL